MAARNDHGRTPLHHAARRGRPDVVELLLEHGADVTAVTSGSMSTPLHAAARSAGPDTVILLFAHGADPNPVDGCGQTPLHKAVDIIFESPRLGKIALLLLDSGANSNAIDQDGNTPLHLAAKWSAFWSQPLATETIELLLERGANVDLTNDKGKTACDLASADDVDLRRLLCPHPD